MNYILYLQIKTWFEKSLIDPTSPTDLILRVGEELYACIGYDSSSDIQVNMYEDEDCEEPTDGGGCCEMSDMYDFFDTLEGGEELSQEGIDALDTLIKDKSEFLYELCFTA